MTRDTWAGNNNKPLSLNRWVYGYDNPVIYADPSGRFPEFCRSMPTKATYEACVLAAYGLEPISYHELGMRVSGQQGCYKGPTAYRAPGYIEGIGIFQPDPIIVQEWSGNEVVYDFAKMQRASFSYKGSGFSNLLLGGGISLYVGGVMGFRTDKDIVEDYGGPFRVAQLGVSLSLIVGVGTGITGFRSLSDPLVRGDTSYIGGSIGVGNILKFIKIIDAGYSPALEYTVLDRPTNYYQNGKLDKNRLLNDIGLGVNSPLGPPFEDEAGVDMIRQRGAARGVAYLMALHYSEAFEELHEK